MSRYKRLLSCTLDKFFGSLTGGQQILPLFIQVGLPVKDPQIQVAFGFSRKFFENTATPDDAALSVDRLYHTNGKQPLPQECHVAYPGP